MRITQEMVGKDVKIEIYYNGEKIIHSPDGIYITPQKITIQTYHGKTARHQLFNKLKKALK